MKVKVEKFCALATSPSWQAWLFHFNADLYRRFIKRLQESRGCGQNRDLMIEILGEIDKLSGNEKLLGFLHQHYPHILINEAPPVRAEPSPESSRQVVGADEIFEHYNPNLLTYPRRIIFTGSARELKTKVQSFLLDKIKSDSVIVGEKAYVEYLTADDAALKDSIPQKNWRIAAWKLRSANL